MKAISLQVGSGTDPTVYDDLLKFDRASNTLVFNEAGDATAAMRFEGGSDANLFYLDPVNDRVGVGTATPAAKLDVNGNIIARGGSVTVHGTNPSVIVDEEGAGNNFGSFENLSTTTTRIGHTTDGATAFLDLNLFNGGANPGQVRFFRSADITTGSIIVFDPGTSTGTINITANTGDMLMAGDLLVDGGNIGITANPDLLALSLNELTVNGDLTLFATHATLLLDAIGNAIARFDRGTDGQHAHTQYSTGGTVKWRNGLHGSLGEDYVISQSYTPANPEFVITDSTHRVGIGIVPLTKLHTAVSTEDNTILVDTYSVTNAAASGLTLRKSDNNTIGTVTQTDDGDILGAITFVGVANDANFHVGAQIRGEQVGASGGVLVPTKLVLETNSNTALNTDQLVLKANGDISISGEWDGLSLKNTTTFTRGVYVVSGTIDFNDVTPQAIATVGDGYVVVDVYIEITTAFDGGAPFVQVGDGGSSVGFITQLVTGVGYFGDDVAPRGAYLWDGTSSQRKIYTGAETVVAKFVTGGGATQGEATIFVVIQKLK